jgi:hypothetical protein
MELFRLDLLRCFWELSISHDCDPLVSGFFTGFLWDTAQNFAVRTGVATRQGLVLIAEFLVVPSNKLGERTTRSSAERQSRS